MEPGEYQPLAGFNHTSLIWRNTPWGATQSHSSRADIDRYRQGDIPLSGIAIQHLVQHTYMQQGHWHAVLHALHEKAAPMSVPEYIRKILLPALESTYHSPRDHVTMIALHTTSISELDWLPLNVSSFPALLHALQVEAAI